MFIRNIIILKNTIIVKVEILNKYFISLISKIPKIRDLTLYEYKGRHIKLHFYSKKLFEIKIMINKLN